MNLNPSQFKRFLGRKPQTSSRMMTPLARPESTPATRAADRSYGQMQDAKKTPGSLTSADYAYQKRMQGGYR